MKKRQGIGSIVGAVMLSLGYATPSWAYGGNDWGIVPTLLIFVLVMIVIFLVCRELICWYWKINETIAVLTDIRSLLQQQARGGAAVTQAKGTTVKAAVCGNCQARYDGAQAGQFCENCGKQLPGV